MQIIFLARRFYPDIGGVEKHVYRLSKELSKRGHHITIIAEQGSTETQTKFTYKGIRVYKIAVGTNWFKKFRVWQALWVLRREVIDADIVHCHDVFYWYLPFRLLYPFKRVYTTFHGYEGYPIRRRAVWMRKLSEKLSWGNICIGDFIEKWYGTKPTYVSYGAVDIMRTRNEELRMKNDIPSALFYGRLDDQTGIQTYVESYKQIRKKIPSFQLCVIGDGEYKQSLPKDIVYLPFQKDPTKYLTTFHFAFVSRYLSILEAFAARRLVFAVYDNPVKKDYLLLAPYAQFIVIAGSSEELYKKIIYYIKNPKEEQKLVSDAYKWVLGQTWDKVIQMYLQLWSTK